jgi:hypothetical protein
MAFEQALAEGANGTGLKPLVLYGSRALHRPRIGISCYIRPPSVQCPRRGAVRLGAVPSRQEKPGKGESHVGDERKPIEGNLAGQSPSGKG